jgi:archaellum biogenesis ATPase FlaH
MRMEIGRIENGSQPFAFKTETWDELIGTEEPEIEFVVDEVIPAGCLLLLAGKPKVGKSLLGLLIALSEDRERLYCDKYKIPLESIVETCRGYMSISEGLDQLIIRMRANGELPEGIEDERHVS